VAQAVKPAVSRVIATFLDTRKIAAVDHPESRTYAGIRA